MFPVPHVWLYWCCSELCGHQNELSKTWPHIIAYLEPSMAPHCFSKPALLVVRMPHARLPSISLLHCWIHAPTGSHLPSLATSQQLPMMLAVCRQADCGL